MNLPGQPQSLWLATTNPAGYPSLQHGIEVDVAVLGGGIAGLLTAYELKLRGKTVAVIEARELATGTTGYTTAHLSIGHELIYARLAKDFGIKAAQTYAQANQAGIHRIGAIAAKEGIEADYQSTDAYVFTPKGMDTSPLKQELDTLKHLAIPADFVQQPPLSFPTAGAIRYPGQARFHPRKFLLGLAQKIVGDGSYIFEHTRALDVKEDEPAVVETTAGNLKATDVVVATLFPFLDRGLYFARQEVYSSYVLAVTLKDDFPDALFDSTEDHSHYFRRQPYQNGYLVLVGGEGHATGTITDTDERYRNLEAYARDRFAVDSIKFRWSTHDTYPFDGVPYIGKFLPTSDHLYVVTGFQGWGMAHGAVAGQIIADLITGKSNPWAELYGPGRFRPTAAAKEKLQQSLKVGGMVAKDMLTTRPELQPDQLKAGDGKVVEVEGDKVAAARDTKGQIHLLSAQCQHQGCTVGFNRAEQTWDCPCHGSSYTIDGEVIAGPTVKPLPKLDMANRKP